MSKLLGSILAVAILAVGLLGVLTVKSCTAPIPATPKDVATVQDNVTKQLAQTKEQLGNDANELKNNVQDQLAKAKEQMENAAKELKRKAERALYYAPQPMLPPLAPISKLIGALGSANENVRNNAMYDLMSYWQTEKPEAAAPELVKALSDANPDRRKGAGWVLIRGGAHAVKYLRPALESENDTASKTAMYVAVHIGDPAVVELEKMVTSTTGEPKVRMVAKQAIDLVNSGYSRLPPVVPVPPVKSAMEVRVESVEKNVTKLAEAVGDFNTRMTAIEKNLRELKTAWAKALKGEKGALVAKLSALQAKLEGEDKAIAEKVSAVNTALDQLAKQSAGDKEAREKMSRRISELDGLLKAQQRVGNVREVIIDLCTCPPIQLGGTITFKPLQTPKPAPQPATAPRTK